MLRILGLIFAICVGVQAVAENDSTSTVIVAECREGGCNCTESALPVADIEVLLGELAPQEMVPLVVLDSEDGLSWSYVPVDDLEVIFGGDGSCKTELPPLPEDGIWSRQGQYVSIDCGAASAMLRASTEPYINVEVPPRIAWGGVFDGSIYNRAWIAANPDPENMMVPFTQTSATVSEGSLTMAPEGTPVTGSYRFELLSPRLFRIDWHFRTQTQVGPCGWHMRYMVRKIAD